MTTHNISLGLLVLVGNYIGHYLWQACTTRDWACAWDRSYWQTVVMITFLFLASR